MAAVRSPHDMHRRVRVPAVCTFIDNIILTVSWCGKSVGEPSSGSGAAMLSLFFASMAMVLSLLCVKAQAQTPPLPTTPVEPSHGAQLPPIRVTAKHNKPHPAPTKPATPPAAAARAQASPAPPYVTGAPNIAGGAAVPPTMASQMTVTGQDLNARPVARPGEILEVVPGLAVVMHADGGKANQYYLRGYNLDHGTDLAIFVDDMPINLPTHAHGQGYADLNWLMPQTVASLNIRKGPYFADVGDFATAGSLFINLRDSVDKTIAEATVGSFDYLRYFGMGATKLGNGTLLYAGEVNTYNGPWDTPDDMHKLSGLLRYSQGTATDGFSATAMAYSNTWNSTDQIPLRAIASGLIGLDGELDPTDGGNTNRFSLSARLAQTDDGGQWKANGYVVKYGLDLYNNFTWFLTDPVNGDQFHQHDDRIYGGGGVSRTIQGSLFGRPTETVFGVQSRYDDITARADQYGAAPVPVERTCRPCQRRQCRRLCREHGALDRLAEDDRRLARRLLCGVGGFDPATGELRQRQGRDRQSRNCASCSGRSTKPNSSSASAWAITATTRAA